MTSGTGAGAQHRWAALIAAVTSLFMTLVDVSIVVVALPTLGQQLHASSAQLQWVVSGYALAFGIVPVIAGRLGDDHGRRRMLLVGSSAFVLTSLVAGFAPTIEVLVAARVVQGLAGGLLNPQVSGIIQQLFAPQDRGRAFGFIGTMVGVASAAGPVLGGVIIGVGGDEWGWRLCFLVNVPIGLASIVACWRLLPAQVRDTRRSRGLDLTGAALLALGLFSALFPFVQFDSDHDLSLGWILVAAVVFGVAFWRWERGPAARRGHPLIDLALFRVRSFTAGVVLALFFFVAFVGMSLVLALFVQDGLGFSALQSGLTATAYAVGAGVSAAVAGRWVRRFGRRLLVGALVLFVLGVAGAALVAATLAGAIGNGAFVAVLAVPLFVAGLGGGGVLTPNQALSYVDVDARSGSTAGGMLQTAQRIGAATSSVVVGAVFFAVSAHAPAAGARRADAFGDAYAVALAVSLVFALCALVVAVRDARREAVRDAGRVASATSVASGPAAPEAGAG
ncbi:MFS transporter [Jatrophihabitans sp. YIM 134969]